METTIIMPSECRYHIHRVNNRWVADLYSASGYCLNWFILGGQNGLDKALRDAAARGGQIIPGKRVGRTTGSNPQPVPVCSVCAGEHHANVCGAI